jgi:DNA-3-methyladenine glycosylase II
MPRFSAVNHLCSRDPILAKVIKRLELPERKEKRVNHFRSLVSSIINQQLSGKAADTIEKRFRTLFPGKRFPLPEDVLKMPTSRLWRSGLSEMKVKYIKNLAKEIVNGKLDFKKLQNAENEEVIIEITRLKGIGRWTAEMFLMFSLNRPDVFSAGDFGLRKAIKNLYGLKNLPDEKTASRFAEKWSPYRALACRYLWASIDLK